MDKLIYMSVHLVCLVYILYKVLIIRIITQTYKVLLIRVL